MSASADRSKPGSLRTYAVACVAVLLVIATIVTQAGGPYGSELVIEEGRETGFDSFTRQNAGPTCVGWPSTLVASKHAPPGPGTVSIGVRGRRFFIVNARPTPVTITVTTTGGTLTVPDSSVGARRRADHTTELVLNRDQDVEFELSCPTSAIEFSSAGVVFRGADGSSHLNTLRVENERRGP